MSDDQNPQQDGDNAGPDDLPAPPTPVPVPAASSSIPAITDIPLSPVVGGGPTPKPDGGGEDVSQKPWLWLLVALVALVIAAIVLTQCSGSEAPPATSVVGSQPVGSSTSVANAASTTVASSVPTSVPTSSVDPTTPSTGPVTQPTTPGDPTTTVAGGGGGGGGGGTIAPEQLIGLQAQCVYGDDQAACDTLVAGGYTQDSNYGLGDSLTSRTDAELSADCSANIDQLACLELASRYPGTAADEQTADEFAKAVVEGDIATVESLSAVYVTEQNPELISGPYATTTDPGTRYSDGKFAFTIDESNKAVCWISDGVVVFCLINAA